MIALRALRGWRGNLLLLVLLIIGTWLVATGSFGLQSIVTVTAVYIVLAISLDLVAGSVGLFSLGHAGLFAIGAYGTSLLSRYFDLNPFHLLPIVITAAAIVGAVLGGLSLRVGGLYFAITTFIFTIIVYVILGNSSWTMGLQGLPGPLFPAFPGALGDVFGTSTVWMVSAVLLVATMIVWGIRDSAFYPVLLAVRDADAYARANGVRTARVKISVFALSAALAAMAGWAFSFLVYQSPGQFNWVQSVYLLVMVIIGGIDTRFGPILGAILVSVFPFVVTIDPFWQNVVFGAVFVVVIVFFPRGIVGIASSVADRVRRPTTPDDVDGEPLDAAGLAPITLARTSDGEASGDIALAAKGIAFSYIPGVPVLQNIEMIVRRGTIHGLIGPNGSGKSTLVNLISGELRPASGSIELNGSRVERLRAPSRPSRGLMRTFQSAVLVQELPLSQSTQIGLYNAIPHIASRSVLWNVLPSARRDQRMLRDRSIRALSAVGLERRWHGSAVRDVPHGIEQLTQLAASLVSRPSILVLDEPLAGLSNDEIAHVTAILHRLRDEGMTIVVIEHQTRFIFDNCDEVTVIAAGELVASGPAETVRDNTRVRKVYLGQ